jgi:photosynthetic reaction center cytochrome c subunit
MMQNNLFPDVTGTDRGQARVVALLVAGAIAVLSIATFWFIFYTLIPGPADPIVSDVYVNYDIQPAAGQEPYLLPESLAAMAAYTQQFPQPQNVQVLTGMTTAQISAYMVQQVSGGLKVDCSYCHNVANFAQEDGYPNAARKIRARAMMLMSADLNQNYVAQLPASVGGYQVTCATCHNGKPILETYPTSIMNTLPNDWTLPFDQDYPGVFTVTGDRSKSNAEVEQNQFAMYHMNVSLGQGCTFCHNARYFPSDEIAQKGYAMTMLNMTNTIYNSYVAPGGNFGDGIMAGKSPSCWMCHQGARIPPGAAKPGTVPTVLSRTPNQ